MIGWRDDDLGDEPISTPCTYVVDGEPCGSTEDLSLLEGRVLCEEHREAVLEARRRRRWLPWG